MFTFCDDVEVLEKRFMGHFLKRLYGGLIPLQMLNHSDKIRNWICESIANHLMVKYPNLESTLESINEEVFAYENKRGPLYDDSKDRKYQGFINKEAQTSALVDIRENIKIMLKDPHGPMQHPSKIQRKKAIKIFEALVEVEPNFKFMDGWGLLFKQDGYL